MTLSQRTELRWDSDGERYPVLYVRADGVHDVGRLAATLARGNCEHGSIAREIGRALNRTKEGRATLAYLERHGGPKLAPPPCEECDAGNHAGCWHLSDDYDPTYGDVCGCFEAGEWQHFGLEATAVDSQTTSRT